MATQLFLVPQEFNAQGSYVPKYTGTDLQGHSYIAMPFGVEGVALVATDPNPALAGESDVYAFPENLDTATTDDDASNIQNFFEGVSIPDAFIVSGMTFRDIVKGVAQIFQVAQRCAGLAGVGIFTRNTVASIQSTAAQIKAGALTTDAANAPISQASSKIGGVGVQPVQPAQPTLSTALADNAALQANLTSVAASFGFTAPDNNSTAEEALYALGQQFTAPLLLSRGDGFQI